MSSIGPIDNAVIVDVEATPARTYDEVAATKTMLDRTETCFDLKPKRLAADTAYGTGKFLGWLVKEKKIAPHIPVWERPKRQDGVFATRRLHLPQWQATQNQRNGAPRRETALPSPQA